MAEPVRDYQSRAIEGLYQYFEHKNGNPLVVVPTGGGKSVIIGALCQQILHSWPHQRVMILSHVKELLQQNFDKITAFWPGAPAGLYCAGLNAKRARDPITVGSIQSVYRKAHVFGWRDLLLIDECHLLAPSSGSMYRQFIQGLREVNPRLKVIGFTATPYRLQTGMLTEGEDRLFTDIACEISMPELLQAGHISRMIGKASVVQADLSGVRITAGEFNAGDMEKAMDKEALTKAALDEVFALAGSRRSWLFFCSGVGHAEHVRDALVARGIEAATVTAETPAQEREDILTRFKAGDLKAVTNANVLTTGFDAPNIDLIAMLRSTTSPGLFIQMAGRGLRLAPGKENCLLLDYGGNLERHGPIDQIRPPKAGTKRGPRDSFTKTCLICPHCRMASPLGSLECGECGHSFERPERVNHDTEASAAAVMSGEGPAPEDLGEWHDVDQVRYFRHEKEGGHPSMKVEYQCGAMVFREWVCVEHPPGFARAKAIGWWKRRYSGTVVPDEVWKALHLADMLKRPGRVRVKRNGKYWEITGYDFAIREAGPVQEEAVAAAAGGTWDFG